MALSLRAEQKNVTNLFTSGEDVYVIPEYQRPYSWSRDTCYQLYSDITTAFIADEDYFLGNIIMARSVKERTQPNIVDGQQRLITIWLFLKVLTVLHPDKSRLKRTLEVESVLSDLTLPRISSKAYEHNDQKNLESVLAYNKKQFEYNWNHYVNNQKQLDERSISRMEVNALYLYAWISEFYDNLNNQEQKEEFLKYFLERVYFLPIELDGDTIEDASFKALTIFETINNRGQILEDSDIFKARLYKAAKKEGKEEDFIEQWIEFNNTCSDLGYVVDDLFRFYYHILRGKDGQTTNEVNLREYLIKDKNSALAQKRYQEVVQDLSKISTILQWLNTPESMTPSVAKWLQVLNLYSNQYPKYALVNYLFVRGLENEKELTSFLYKIVRYYYYRGATIQVKYETYKINKLIASGLDIPHYDCSDFFVERLEHMGALKKGYALLAHYLLDESFCKTIFFDTLIMKKDIKKLSSEWCSVSDDDIKNSIANIVVLDRPKCSLLFNEKVQYYRMSNFQNTKNIFYENKTYTPSDFKNRELKLKTALIDFFKDNLYE